MGVSKATAAATALLLGRSTNTRRHVVRVVTCRIARYNKSLSTRTRTIATPTIYRSLVSPNLPRGIVREYSTDGVFDNGNSNSSSSSNSNSHSHSHSHSHNSNNNYDDDHKKKDHYSHLLTKATARQLKGDVAEAIALTSRALSILKAKSSSSLSPSPSPSLTSDETQQQQQHQQDESKSLSSDDDSKNEEIADTLLFLGKLQQLQGSTEDAIETFAESRTLYKQQQQQHQQQHEESSWSNRTKRKELVALSHLASAKGRWEKHGIKNAQPNIKSTTNTAAAIMDSFFASSVDEDFREALEGLEDIVGWKDGMTNHTAHEWSLYCSNTRNDPEKALSILTNMKEKISDVFGSDDHRVLQLNGEMAELWRTISTTNETTNPNQTNRNEDGAVGGDGDSNTDSKRSNNNNNTTNKAEAEKNAMSLLEEALDRMPPNSPEARRIFMQLEEWKETEQEEDKERLSNNNDGTVTVTVTRAKRNGR